MLVGRADHRDPAVVDDADAVGLLGLLEVVGRQEDRRPVLAADVAQVRPQAVPADRVEPGRRLVEEQDPRPVHEAADDLELALHAARVRLERLEQVVVQADDARPAARSAAVLGRHQPVERPVAVDPVQRDVEPDVLLAGEVQVEARVLEDDPDAAPDGGRVTVEVVAGDRDRAARLGEGRRQDRDGRRLAGAVRAEEGEQLARLDIEADVVDRRGAGLPVALGQVVDGDDRSHGGSCGT